MLSVDGTSSLEIGTAGGAAVGALTIDAGVTVTEDASFTAPSIVNNGTVIVENGGFSTGTGISNGSISLSGTLSGSGQFEIGSNAQLTVGAVSNASANTIAFVGTSGILSISSTSLNSLVFQPTITGFGSSDAIDYAGTVTSASYASGNLTLLNGSTTVATLHLSGNYAGETFITLALSPSSTQISLYQGPSDVPPVVAVPGQQTVAEGVSSKIPGVSIADSTPGASLSVAISDSIGLLSANTGAANGGGTITGSGTKNLTIVGTLAQINADLTTLSYQGTAVGSDNIVIAANDGLGGVTDAQVATTVTSTVPDNFNGDTYSDILYRNDATGDTGFYEIVNGANTGWSPFGASSTAYGIVGVGDFTGSGTDDILFRDNTTGGDTGFYEIVNGANTGWVDIGATSTAYSVVGIGDFTGSGTDDILFRDNATGGDTGFYLMSNGANTGWQDIGATSTAYSVVGVGDFTGSGTDDILFRDNATSGDTGFYEMVNGINTGWDDIGASSTAYTVVATGDYTGDGTSDILFRNAATGDTGFYAISNGVNTGWHDIGVSSTAYHVVS